MANGYRVSKTVNDDEIRYLWNGDNIVCELNSQNVFTAKYYRGHNLICDNSNNYYYHDPHGNLVEIKKAGTTSDRYLYNAFGTNKYLKKPIYRINGAIATSFMILKPAITI